MAMLWMSDESICLEILTAIVGVESCVAQGNKMADFYTSYALGLLMGRFGMAEAGEDLDALINKKLPADDKELPQNLGLHTVRMVTGLKAQGRELKTIGEYVQFLETTRSSFGGGNGLQRLVPQA